MPVATFQQPNFESQTGTVYKTAIDNATQVMARLAAMFAAHEQSTPNMTLRLDAGALWVSEALVEKAAQNTATITKPTTNPRIDRVVIDKNTGTVSVITGTEAASPSPPAITTGKLPVAQVLLQTTTTVITNDMITDERIGGGGGGSEAWPIDSVFISVVAINPNTLLGYGTWAAFGTGKMLVGFDAGQTEFNTVEKTGGAKRKNHNHHLLLAESSADGIRDSVAGACYFDNTLGGSAAGDTTDPKTVNVLNPYIVVYMWKRTA